MRLPFAVWVQGRVQRRLEAAVARLEEELQQMEGPAKSPAESASCLPGEFSAALRGSCSQRFKLRGEMIWSSISSFFSVLPC